MTFSALLDAMAGTAGAAVDALRDFDREAALAAGIDPSRVRAWAKVHHTYFGPTRTPRRQRDALAAARASGHSLDQLALIERRLAPIDDPSLRHCHRLALLAFGGTYDSLRRRATALLDDDTDPTPPADTITFSRSTCGKRSLRLTTDERFIADLEHALAQGIDTSAPAAPQMVDNFVDLLRGTHSTAPDDAPAEPLNVTQGVPFSIPRPQLLIPLDQHVQILRGHGDDVVLGLTDGTTMTGADYLTMFTAIADNELEAAVFHPTEGAVNLYRLSRLANAKQRALARATMPVCAGPDCRRGADQCEMHHVTAWSNGGETNVGNIAVLCSYHNRVNDDDPTRRRRGRIEMIRGTPTWVSPRGHPLTDDNPHRRFGAMNALFGAATTARSHPP